jgi:hypothetical protein
MIATPQNLMRGLGLRDIDIKDIDKNISADKIAHACEQLRNQKKYNLVSLRDFVARGQQNFFATGNVNMELLHTFRGVSIADSIVITKRINEVEKYKTEEYSERVLWEYFNDLSVMQKHAFCISGSLSQIDNLMLLKLDRKEGSLLKDGSCFFPVKFYEEFFYKIKPGNNVVVV